MNLLPVIAVFALAQTPAGTPAARTPSPSSSGPARAPVAGTPVVSGLPPVAKTPEEVESLKRTVAVESSTVENTPDDTDALYRLGLAWLALGEPRKAAQALEQLVKKDPESLDGKLLLARSYRAANEPDQARTLLDRAILEKPDEPSLRGERAQLARAQGDLEQAVAHYRKAVELSPGDPDLVFNLAEAVDKSGKRPEETIELYRRAIELEPNLVAAKVNLGKALAEKGLFGQAKEVLSSAARGALSDPEAHYNLGVILMRENNIAAAMTEFERAIAINPKHAPALNNLGIALDSRNESKKALEMFKRAAAADAFFVEAFFNQGLSLMSLNKTHEAARAFEQALKLEPSSTGPYLQLGALYLAQGKKDRAVEAYKKAIALLDAQEKDATGFLQLKKRFQRERSTEAYQGLAVAYLSQGKVEEAVATLRLAVDKLPKDPRARRALGDAYLAQGDFDGAIEQLKERLALEPTSAARLDLARAFARKRVAREAEPLFKQVMKEEPANREAAMGLVDLYTAMGRYADAEGLLKAAIAADAGDAQALSRLGIMKARMGRPNEALEPLEQSVRLNPLLFDARAEYAFLLYRADQLTYADRCVQTMTEILTSEPRHALSKHYLGVCMFTKGNKARAEQAFKEALDIDGTFAAAHFSLGELYEADKRLDDAKRAYELAAKYEHPEAAASLKRLTGGGRRP